jgi:hypothetical protein
MIPALHCGDRHHTLLRWSKRAATDLIAAAQDRYWHTGESWPERGRKIRKSHAQTFNEPEKEVD